MSARASRGFSLIEVTAAVALLGLLIVATGLLFERIPVNGRETRDQDIALKVARTELESLRADGYAGLPEGGPFSDPLLASLASSSAALSVSDFTDTTKRVDVTVSWRGAGLVMRSLSLSTLVTKNSGLK